MITIMMYYLIKSMLDMKIFAVIILQMKKSTSWYMTFVLTEIWFYLSRLFLMLRIYVYSNTI